MPELPEVETVKNELTPHIIGHRITGVSVFWDRMVRHPSPAEFRSCLIGRKITGISRRGKYLIFSLDGGQSLVMHLKMSGSLLLDPAPSDADKYTRAVIHLDNNASLHFRDPRKFGAMWLVDDKNMVVGKLGPEPLTKNFTPQVLARLLQNRTAPIKALLCDQTLIAGIGNMYADEALFAAGIHPLRPGGKLSSDEVKRLHSAIQDVLQKAIGNKGASIVNYYRPGGESGTAHFHFQVAHRGNKPCLVCGAPIQRIPIRNRGSYFCPHCQPS